MAAILVWLVLRLWGSEGSDTDELLAIGVGVGVLAVYFGVPLAWNFVLAGRRINQAEIDRLYGVIAEVESERDQARSRVAHFEHVERLRKLDAHLRGILNRYNEITRGLEREVQAGAQGLERRVRDDEHPLWVNDENKKLRQWLIDAGFPELVPQLVVEDVRPATYGELLKEHVAFYTRVANSLSGDFFAPLRDV